MGAVVKAKSSLLSIGQVCSALGEFSDLTASKIRFLEDEGLITPERTASGYRKYSQWHVERLRMILTLQRDYFLPLKAISELLEQVDQGLNPVIPGGADRTFATIMTPAKVLDREELQRLAEVSAEFLQDVINHRLLPVQRVFSADSVAYVKALHQLAKMGLGPRHMRAIHQAAIREAELIASVIAAKGKVQAAEKQDNSLEISALLGTVHSNMVRQALLAE